MFIACLSVVSTSMLPFCNCMVANLPTSDTVTGVTVSDVKTRGYLLTAFPPIMHGEFGFSIAQGISFRHNFMQIFIEVRIRYFSACYIIDFI